LDAEDSVDVTRAKSKVREDLGRVVHVVLINLSDGNTRKAGKASGRG
jgi:hypothetical protein